MSHVDFAILAPIPAEHLESGLALWGEYVSFGSHKWELFRKVDELRRGAEVPVLIYPSHETDVVKLTFQVEWFAWYIGHVDDSRKFDDETSGRRPPTTARYPEDNASGWSLFWRVRSLVQLPPEHHLAIREVETYKTGNWRKNSPPRGPEIVARPAWVD